ncbi:MAG: agmatine deiminase family protein [Pseudomonadota bacterium]
MSAVAATPTFASSSRWYVPAEEEPHIRTFMQWPVSRRVYGFDGFLSDVQETIAEIANTISEFEPVIMLADEGDHAAARRQLSTNVALWPVPTEDLWARDSGPLFASDGLGGQRVQSLNFNGWGEKQVHRRDGKIAARVAEIMELDLAPSPITGEPGGVEQDGHGNLIAHESSWIIDNRNPGMSKASVTEALLHTYGADRLVWAPGLRDLDITDYHIDSLARFTGPGRILINLPDEPIPGEPYHVAALETHDILQAAGFEIEVIPEPNRRRVRSDDFVASYVNYYVCNGAVIAAQFGDQETDEIAADALARHYPGREVVMLNADNLGEIGGGIHCATQQQPVP